MLLATGHGAGQLVAPLFEARKNRKHLVDVSLDAVLIVANVGAHLQVLDDGHAREHAAAFRHHGQALLDQVPRALALDAAAQVFNVPGVDRQGAGNGLHGGGFARTVGADQGNEFAFMHFKIDALDGLNAAIGHLEIADFE